MNSRTYQIIGAVLISMYSCVPAKSVFLARPDTKDQHRFESSTVEASDTCFEFHPFEENSLEELKINDWTKDIPFFVSIKEFVSTHNIRSLAIIQNDTLKYNYSNDSFDENTLHPSYSIAKSFTSALIGIAIEEGFIEHEQEPVVTYIPELKELEYAEQLTIEHLLNHTSGLKYRLSTDATIYYGRNSLNVLDRLKFDTIPGTKQHYLNVNVYLLGLILQRATNIPPSEYLQEKIWKPIGMCTDAEWSIDKVNQLEKAFCCIGATTLDYAKFGRLYLNKGVWEGKQVIRESWYNKSISRDTTDGSSFNYNYSWHIGLKEYGDFMAIGMNKQHLYIHPEKNVVIVLLNDHENRLKAERVNWWNIFRQIVDQL